MSGKSDLSTIPNIQNVVVYVSDDSFAQSYEDNQQNVQQNSHPIIQNSTYQDHVQHMAPQSQPQHMASIVGQPKLFPDKQQALKALNYPAPVQHPNQCLSQREYYANVAPQNGLHPAVSNSINYPPPNLIGHMKTYNTCDNSELMNQDSQEVRVRLDVKMQEDCDVRDTYVDANYVTVKGVESQSQSARCDSVRSETAESSCSSLSSVEEGMVIVQNPTPEMVVYDSSVCVRPSGVVLAVGSAGLPQQQAANVSLVGTIPPNNQLTPVINNQLTPVTVTVPYGWKRLVNAGSVIYISPSNTALTSPEQVKEYLQSAGTCKCGLECPFKYDSVFNFDPKVSSKPWVLSPDTNTGDLTKLCNHKRKIIAMASLDCKPPDPNIKLQKDINIKRKKRKFGIPCGTGVGIPQIMAHGDKFGRVQQHFTKDAALGGQQVWSQASNNSVHLASNRVPNFPENRPNDVMRYHNQENPDFRTLNNSAMIIGDAMMIQQHAQDATNISQHSLTIANQQASQEMLNQNSLGPNRHMGSVQATINANQIPTHLLSQTETGQVPPNLNNTKITLQSQSQTAHQQRVVLNAQSNEPSGPGRPNVQMIPFSINNQQRQPVPCRIQNPQMYNNQYSQLPQYDSKYLKPYSMPAANNQMVNGFKPHILMTPQNQTSSVINSFQKIQWQNKMQANQNNIPLPMQNPNSSVAPPNVYERVPPLHHSPLNNWQEEIIKKKTKIERLEKKRSYNILESQSAHMPCPNIDVRQIPPENNRSVAMDQASQNSQVMCSPSFMEDPSGYLAQQTALLNNTINRQTGASTGFIPANSAAHLQAAQPHAVMGIANTPHGEIQLPSNIILKNQSNHRSHQTMQMVKAQIQQGGEIPQHYNQMMQGLADSSALNEHTHCKDCIDNQQMNRFIKKDVLSSKSAQNFSRPNSKPSTPSSPGTLEDPVTSSTSSEKQVNMSSPNTLPIQGATVSTSNISPAEGAQSDPPTPAPQTPTPSQQASEMSHSQDSNTSFSDSSQNYIEAQQNQNMANMREVTSSMNYTNSNSKPDVFHHMLNCSTSNVTKTTNFVTYTNGIVTTMASGRTVSSNTITSVLAGRANTATVSVNNPTGLPPASLASSNITGVPSSVQTQCVAGTVSKSPLEMVQSVVSSIQVPHSQQPALMTSSNLPPSSQFMKHSPTGLPSGHILVSSGGQLIMASSGNGQPNVMPPPPPPAKIIASHAGMPPISASSMITNVTASVTQVIPAVAQQVLGQQTVLVNALPAPFVLQPGVAMTMDGMTVGQNVQIPQIVTGNVIQHQIQIDHSDLRHASSLMSPDMKKKGKKRKVGSQTVANMLQIAAQQNPGVVMSQQGFPQQIQMTHSPQGLAAGSVMQALTLVPSKTNGPPQIVMNSQPMSNTNLSAQQLIANSQPTQHINLLQPVNIINGGTGVVPNFPTIQQFIVPNLGGMVMNPDGTATLLQDTSNIGMQLQLQTVNGQNVLTPVQNNAMFNGGQNIIASGPTGMVIRSPTASQGKIIHHQPHSPGAQFLSPNSGQFVVNGSQFSGQISPLVANVNAPQQVTFNASPQQIRPSNSVQQSQQEFIHCGQIGQTLMVPCSLPGNITSSSNQNTTFVQQNTTIVQQQTTMVSNNQQLQEFSSGNQPSSSEVNRTPTLNVDEKFVITTNDNKPLQAMIIPAESPNSSSIHRQSVSTQTAVNQSAHSVTTNTFCQTSTLSAGSPPDTTTHSPLSSSGEQSPANADTTTHSGNIDDGLSSTSSNCSGSCDVPLHNRQEQSSTMPMVHCISSSEPDSADLNIHGVETDWSKNHNFCPSSKAEFSNLNTDKKNFLSPHFTYAESSNMVANLQFIPEEMKNIESVGSSRQFDKTSQKRKKSNILSHHLHSSVMEDEELR